MEVTKTYPVNRIMHLKPNVEVVMRAKYLYEKYSGLELFCRNPEEHDKERKAIECREPLALLANHIGRYNRVEVVAKGWDFPREILERCADQVGEVFGRQSDDSSDPDWLFRNIRLSKKECEA